MRSASIERNTKETQIRGRLAIEGSRGRYEISTGIRFFDQACSSCSPRSTAASILSSRPSATLTSINITPSKTWASYWGSYFRKALLGDRRGIFNRAGYFVLLYG